MKLRRTGIKAPSPAMVVALIALFMALGGSAYAIQKNSVGTAQLKKNAVTTAKIKNGAVKSGKLGAGAVTDAKLATDVRQTTVAAYASIDGFGPTIQGTYKKNVTGVTRTGTGRYCLSVDWVAAGRDPVPQGTPVIVSPRDPTQNGGGDVYSCPNDGVSITLNNSSNNPVDGWVHVLIP